MSDAPGKKTIMVIEDKPLNMKLAVDLLELNGFNALKAFDGKSALEILKENVPDLILMDIGLPDMDGFELFKKLKEDKRLDKVRIGAFTASVMKEDEEKIKEVGFNFYIKKPIDTKAFIETIKNLVKGSDT
ncbi:MAG: response regulator [Omnitrophica bacterium]|nr:response regulator [Candidatus Omnitrophota bacterium]